MRKGTLIDAIAPVILLARLVRDQHRIVMIIYPKRLGPNSLHEKVAIVVHVIRGETIGRANQNACLARICAPDNATTLAKKSWSTGP